VAGGEDFFGEGEQAVGGGVTDGAILRVWVSDSFLRVGGFRGGQGMNMETYRSISRREGAGAGRCRNGRCQRRS